MESVTALFSMTEERFRALNPDLTLTTEVTLASSPLEEESEENAQVPAAEDPAEGEAANQAAKTAEEAENATIDLADLLGTRCAHPWRRAPPSPLNRTARCWWSPPWRRPP